MKKYILSLVMFGLILFSFSSNVFASDCTVLLSNGLLSSHCGGEVCAIPSAPGFGGDNANCPNYVLARMGKPVGWSEARLISFAFKLAGNTGLRAIWIGTWDNPGTIGIMAALLSSDPDLQSIGAVYRARNIGTYRDYLNLTSLQKQYVVSALTNAGVTVNFLKEIGLGVGGLPDSYAWKQDRINLALSATFIPGEGSARVEGDGKIVWIDSEGNPAVVGNAFDPTFDLSQRLTKPVVIHKFAAGTAVAGSSDPRTVEQNATLRTITMPNSSLVRPEYRGKLLLPDGTISSNLSLLNIPPARSVEIIAILAAGTDINKPSGGYLLILNRDGIPIQYMGVQPTAAVCTVLLTPGASLSVGMTREFLQAICSDVLPADSPLLVRIAIPPPVLDPVAPPVSTKFIAGNLVKVNFNNLNVRASASTSATFLGKQLLNAIGTVKSGPINASGFTWWNIDYVGGADGWSVENYLDKTSALVPVPASVPASTTNQNSGTCITLKNNLRYKSQDPEVLVLQKFLKEQKYLNAEPNGFFNSSTLAAVKNFQRNNGINPTGYVGIFTRKAINEVSCDQ